MGSLRQGQFFRSSYSRCNVHSDLPKLTCRFQQSFDRNCDLSRHTRIHTNERPYHCTEKNCNKKFIQRSALTVHIRTHTGEKPHACGYTGCQKAFADIFVQSSSRARHRRIHTGDRPFICEEPMCGISFCRKSTLSKHQQSSHPQGALARRPPERSHGQTSLIDTSLNEQSLPAQRPNSSKPADQGHKLDLSYASFPNNESLPLGDVSKNRSHGKASLDIQPLKKAR
ncbi:hypothetical protein N7522_003024 [Penicillium canescens]|nr:hypothetical protein N7522_003024 [Penicillium canescens]